MAPTSTRKTSARQPARSKAAREKTTQDGYKTGKPRLAGTSQPAIDKAAIKTTEQSKADSNPPGMTPEERRQMIAVAAYHRAQQRGFARGAEVEDWLEAEKEIEILLAG
ncbi:MAG: DUF2934 domain-containing protein [Pseudomonadota bacterium]